MRFSINRLVGISIVFLLIVACILMGGSLDSFIDIPSLLITAGTAFGLTLCVYGSDFFRFIPRAVLALVVKPKESNPKFAEIAAFCGTYVIGGGVLGTLITLIQMLQSLNDPSRIGSGMAVSILTMFYALILRICIFVPISKSFMPCEEKREDFVFFYDVFLPIGIVMLIFLSFFILLCTISGPSEPSAKKRTRTSCSSAQVIWNGSQGQVTFPETVVNIKGTEAGRYARCQVVMEFGQEDLANFFRPFSDENPHGCYLRITSIIIDTLGDAEWTTMLSPSERGKLAEKIKSNVNSSVFKNNIGKVTNVFFPFFLIQ